MVRIDKNYVFDGPDVEASLLDMFEGRRQLLLYHFMFAPASTAGPKRGDPAVHFALTSSVTLHICTPAIHRSR